MATKEFRQEAYPAKGKQIPPCFHCQRENAAVWRLTRRKVIDHSYWLTRVIVGVSREIIVTRYLCIDEVRLTCAHGECQSAAWDDAGKALDRTVEALRNVSGLVRFRDITDETLCQEHHRLAQLLAFAALEQPRLEAEANETPNKTAAA